MLPFNPQNPWLAPLAGWSDLPFRLLCREMGAAVCCTEMVSAKGLVYGGKNSAALLATADGHDGGTADSPLVVQIFGAEAAFMEEAVRILRGMGFVWFDVNMGCSVPKVTKTGAGAAMLRDLPNALDVAKAVIRAAGEGTCGFKLRLGWDAAHEVFLPLARELEKLGAAWVTLHPRYAAQGFGGMARLEAITQTVRALSIPVIASGDLFTAEDGARVLHATGCSAVMYARGALRDPRVFALHKQALAGTEGSHAADEAEGGMGLAHVMRRHIALARQYAPQSAFLKMRSFLPRYAKGADGAKALRQAIIACTGWDEMELVIERFEGCIGGGEEHA